MITFKILRAEAGNRLIQVRYSSSGKPDYFVRAHVGGDWTEENILAEAHANHNVEQAGLYWSRTDNTDEVELSVDTGELKDRVYETEPTYDPDTQRVVPVMTETETTITKGYVVEDLTQETISQKIRNQRDQLLAATDKEVLPDRSPSDEILAYRQALRNVPQQEGFPSDIEWPVRPIE